jgi:succinoglycan biosynthesis transport protein ExoP
MLQGNTPLLPPSTSHKLQPARLLDPRFEEDYAKPYQRPRELLDYLSVVLKRKWLILTLVLICTTMAALYLAQQPAIYEATTVIRIEQQTNNFLQTKEVFYTFRSPEYWNTQIQSLRNPHLMYQVAAMLDLPHNRTFLTEPKERGIFAAMRRLSGRGAAPAAKASEPTTNAVTQLETLPSVESNPDTFTVEEQKQLAPYVAALSSNLTVNPVEESNLVAISYRHLDPDIAMKVADAVAYVFL